MPANTTAALWLFFVFFLDLPLSHVLELVWGHRDPINTSVFMNSLKDLLVTVQALQHILHNAQKINTQKNKQSKT